MIITSGYNVYPGQIENILDAHEYVQMSCVIGVPDPYKMQKVKAFVKLAAGVPANDETKQVLLAYCRKNIAKYAMPYDIEFRDDMPKTLVGKVAYRMLEEEEMARIAASANAVAAAPAPAAEPIEKGKKDKKSEKGKYRSSDKAAVPEHSAEASDRETAHTDGETAHIENGGAEVEK